MLLLWAVPSIGRRSPAAMYADAVLLKLTAGSELLHSDSLLAQPPVGPMTRLKTMDDSLNRLHSGQEAVSARQRSSDGVLSDLGGVVWYILRPLLASLCTQPLGGHRMVCRLIRGHCTAQGLVLLYPPAGCDSI